LFRNVPRLRCERAGAASGRAHKTLTARIGDEAFRARSERDTCKPNRHRLE
jgi:hypothetical protein